MGKTKRTKELGEYAEMAQRIIRGYNRRIADEGSLEDLVQLADLASMAQAALDIAVFDLRDDNSWARIGEALGMSGEAARQRWAPVSLDAGLTRSMGVYALCDEQGIRYVGKSVSVFQRVRGYRRGEAHSRALRDWIWARRDTFTVQVLEECDTPAELDAAERKWIARMVEEREELLLNFQMTPRAARKRPPRCPNTEMRWVVNRRIPPISVQCTRPVGHDGDCRRGGQAFGKQPATSTYSRYMEKRGLQVTLDHPEPVRLSA